jgi:hypothetical protein
MRPVNTECVNGRLRIRAAGLAVAVVTMAGCATSTVPGSIETAPPTGSTSAGGTPPPTTSAPQPALVIAHDTDSGHTVDLQPGQRLRVVLASTYWQFGPASDPAVLRSAAAPQPSPLPSGCVPGGGCGSVTETFVAVAAGRTDVTAHRSSCGEAMGCSLAASRFTLHVVVR